MRQRSWRWYWVVSFFLLSALSPLHAQPRAQFEIQLGKATIVIPAPSGFSEIGEYSPETWTAIGKLTEPEQRVLGVFINADDVAAIERGRAPKLNEYAVLQTHASTRELDLSEADFNRLAARLGRAKPIGRPSHTSLVLTQSDNVGSGRQQTRVASATAIVLVQRRILSLIIYRRQQRDSDVEAIASAARNWIAIIKRLNPQRYAPPSANGAEATKPLHLSPQSTTR